MIILYIILILANYVGPGLVDNISWQLNVDNMTTKAVFFPYSSSILVDLAVLRPQIPQQIAAHAETICGNAALPRNCCAGHSSRGLLLL